MTTIITIFFIALLASMILTPAVTRLGLKYKWVDAPGPRKVHRAPIPRIGGVAVFTAFMAPFLCALFYTTQVTGLFFENERFLLILSGAYLMFAVGLYDDIRGLRPRYKFAFQIIAALAAYANGIRISGVTLPGVFSVELGLFSLPATMLWFVLVINAINLIDGLDGLAAGISLFASIVLMTLCIMDGRLLIAVGFASLAGAVAGFLRYNFNPASIFMGDSGSYFIGYMLAALSVMGSIKGRTMVALLVPVIALGVPLMDTIVSPIRRFIRGQKLFEADNRHLHHRLMKLGLTHRNSVLILYGATILMGVMAVFLVNAQDDKIGLILTVIAITVLIGIRKLGYLEYLAVDKIYGWFKDITDEVGISHERRTFLNLQMEIIQSKDFDQMWLRIGDALGKLRFDMAEMELQDRFFAVKGKNGYKRNWIWTRNGFDMSSDIRKSSLMKLELPLMDNGRCGYGAIWLVKDLKGDPINHNTLRRIEQLRRTVMSRLNGFAGLQ